MKKRYLLLVALFSNLLCQAQSPQKWERDLSDSLSQIQKESGIVGFSVALVDQGGIRYTAGFGYADKNPRKEYGPRTVQTIASISKTFIGIALLKAQEEGKLNLDDPVNQYLPFKVFHPRFPDTPITLRHLATHTSGITDPKEYDEKGYVLFKNDNGDEVVYSDFRPAEEMLTLEEYQKRILSVDGEWYRKKTFMNKKPGTWFEYSNIGAGLAALVLEKATGVPFNTYTKAHIFEPLGMSDSGWFSDEVNAGNRSRHFTETGQTLAPYGLVNYPDGGLITSSRDLGNYLSELIRAYNGQGTLLSPESYRELFTEQLTAAQFKKRSERPYNDEYNMSVFMGFSASGQIGHTGGDPGVSTLMFFNSETKVGKLLIVNTDLNEDTVPDFIKLWKTLETFEKEL